MANYYLERADFDNIRISWRKTADAEPVVVYENDFSVRRIQPVDTGVASTTFTHPAIDDRVSIVTNRIYSRIIFNETNANMTQVAAKGDVGNTVPQGLGYGGWRRQNSGGSQQMTVVTNATDKNAAVRFSSGGSTFGVASIKFGEKVTSGVVKARVDVKTPSQWTYDGAYNTAWFSLASADIDRANHNTYGSMRVDRVGLGGTNKTNVAGINTVSYVYADGISNYNGTDKPTYDNDAWYRLESEIDLDNNRSVLRIYTLDKHYSFAGSETVELGTPIFCATNSPILNAEKVKDVGALILAAYGSGKLDGGVKDCVLYDNIRVTKKESLDATSETMLYECDFTTSRMRVPNKSRDFSPTPNSFLYSTDQWIRRAGYGQTKFQLEEDATGKRRLRTVRRELPSTILDYGVLVKSLGKEYKNGKITARMDIRPPAFWAHNNGSHAVYLALGDKVAWQGNVLDANGTAAQLYSNHLFARAGFAGDSSADASTGYKHCKTIRAYARGLNTGSAAYGSNFTAGLTLQRKWYRVEMTAMLTAGTFTARWYRMGEEQPAVDAPNGELIFEQRDIPFGTAFKETTEADITGFSTLLIGAYGAPGTETSPEETQCYISNIVVERRGDGMILTIR